MSNNPASPPLPPSLVQRLTLDAFTRFGPRELSYAPAQSLVPGARSYLNVPFAIIPGFRVLRLDLHVPENAKGPVPVVVFASGGAWLLVVKHNSPWISLPSEGYAVASVEYRPSGEAHYPAALHDLKAAVRWLRGNASTYGVDPNRIAGWGSSAGAHLMALAALTHGNSEMEGQIGDHLEQSSRLSAVISIAGVSDFLTLAEDTDNLPGAMEKFGTETSPETRLLGFIPASCPKVAAQASPVTHVSAGCVPFFVAHGDADTRLGIGQSRRLVTALKGVGADVEYVEVPGAFHNGPEFDTPEFLAQVIAFVKRVI
ncbi:MAG: alpha/beta hydrolase [Proteobacteria bacterium]|nr:alpha/beta hydrolase [Pseudomonadota bacterium]